jgi:hypothetical protein
MAKRKVARKKARKTARGRKTAAKARRKKIAVKSVAFNKKAQWKAYRELQMRADKAWHKFRADVKRNAKSDVLIRDHSHLLLLLGECNYMARECMRIASKGKSGRR